MIKNQNFSKKERVKKNSDFTKILGKGEKHKTKEVIIVALRNDLSHSRLGVSVDKQFKGTVMRNKLKRLAREVFRKNKNKLKGNYDIVVLFRNKIEYKELEDSFIKVLCNA